MTQKLAVLSKKSNIGTMIAIIVLILLIIIAAFVFIYLTYDKEKQETDSYEKIKLYVIAEDAETREFVDANYYLTYDNDTFLKQGNLSKEAYRELIVPKNSILHFHCWSDKYYLVVGHKQINAKELELNRSVFTCSMSKIGKLKITDEINDNQVNLNIKSVGGWYYRMALCFKWSAGILDVSLDDQTIACEDDSWKNWTTYYPENNSYDYLPTGEYKCGEDIQRCDIVIGRRCKLSKMQIPEKYKNQVDFCTYTGKTLSKDENVTLQLTLQYLETINSLDYVKIIFIDHDRRFNSFEDRFTWTYEFNDDDLNYIVKFLNN